MLHEKSNLIVTEGATIDLRVVEQTTKSPTVFQAAETQRQRQRGQANLVATARLDAVAIERYAIRIADGVVFSNNCKMDPNTLGRIIARSIRRNKCGCIVGCPGAKHKMSRFFGRA